MVYTFGLVWLCFIYQAFNLFDVTVFFRAKVKEGRCFSLNFYGVNDLFSYKNVYLTIRS